MPKKRKASALQEVFNLSEAFAVVEKLRKPVSLAKACAVLPHLGNFRPAKVLLASKVPQFIIDFESYSEENAQEVSQSERDVLKELDALSFRKSCRSSLGRHKTSSEILAVCKPIMEKNPNPKKLSQVSAVVETMLSYTIVTVDGDTDEWFEFEKWVETSLSCIPFFTDITDPVLVFIRGQHGGPQPVGLENVLNSIPQGGDPRDGVLSQAPATRLQRASPGNALPPQLHIPNLYEFSDRVDMGLAIAVLRSWATQNDHVLDFSYVVHNNGLVFL